MKIGLFPGQGVSAKDTFEALPAGHRLVDKASEIIGSDLRRRVASAAVTRKAVLPTKLAQPAILVAGCIAYEESDGDFDMLAGHSMGEFTALCCAGAISFKDAVSLVALRGTAMQRAARSNPGGMLALVRLDTAIAEEISKRSGAAIANHNAPTQTVLSGSDQALAEASKLAAEAGGRAVLLAVSGPFHTSAMDAAIDPLADALMRVQVRSPRLPVISNVTARPYRAPGEIRKLLIEQLTSPVHFRQSLEWAARQGVTSYVDLGPGRVVGGLAHQTLGRDLEVADV